MSNLHGRVPRNLWRLPAYRRATVDVKLAHHAIQTGHGASSLPGLWEGDAMALASVTGEPLEWAENALAGLVDAGLAEVDPEHCIVRLPHAPRLDGTSSYKVLLGWFNAFKQLAEAPIKYRHIPDLLAGADMGGPQMAETWESTFARLWDTHRKGIGSPPDGCITAARPTPNKHDHDHEDDHDHEVAAGAAPAASLRGESRPARPASALTSTPDPLFAAASSDGTLEAVRDVLSLNAGDGQDGKTGEIRDVAADATSPSAARYPSGTVSAPAAAPHPRNRKKSPSPSPLPYPLDTAVAALVDNSRGRIIRPDKLTGGQAIALAALVREYPVETLQRFAAWVGDGQGFNKPAGIGLVISQFRALVNGALEAPARKPGRAAVDTFTTSGVQ